MSDYNWCHGPRCHERKTTTRVRGVKGSKVLRTMKIAQGYPDGRGVWNYFCDQTCMHDFFWKHYREFIALYPRTECLETPIEDPVKVKPYENANWSDWRIKPIDNNQG